MKGADVTDFMYVTRALDSMSVSAAIRRTWADLLSHLEETESKAELTLDFHGQIWKNKEAAI